LAKIMLLDYFLYTALTVAALYEKASATSRLGGATSWQRTGNNWREWADKYPPTFGDKHALVLAELARIESRGP